MWFGSSHLIYISLNLSLPSEYVCTQIFEFDGLISSSADLKCKFLCNLVAHHAQTHTPRFKCCMILFWRYCVYHYTYLLKKEKMKWYSCDDEVKRLTFVFFLLSRRVQTSYMTAIATYDHSIPGIMWSKAYNFLPHITTLIITLDNNNCDEIRW